MFAILESVIYNVIGDGKCVHKTEISGSQSSDQTYLIFLKSCQIWWPKTCYLMLTEHYKIEKVAMMRFIKATIFCHQLKEMQMKVIVW